MHVWAKMLGQKNWGFRSLWRQTNGALRWLTWSHPFNLYPFILQKTPISTSSHTKTYNSSYYALSQTIQDYSLSITASSQFSNPFETITSSSSRYLSSNSIHQHQFFSISYIFLLFKFCLVSPAAKFNVKGRRAFGVRCAGEENKGQRSFLSLEEAGLVEISGLSTHEKFLCRLTVGNKQAFLQYSADRFRLHLRLVNLFQTLWDISKHRKFCVSSK